MSHRHALALASGIFLISSACGHPEASHTTPEPPPTSATVARAHEEPLPNLYLATGTVRGRTTTTVTSKTMGYVRAIHVRPGDRVKAGARLVELEANDVRASVARARGALGQAQEAKLEAEGALVAARAASRLAKTSYDRAVVLLADKAIAPAQFDEAEARWHGARAQEQMAEARVRTVSSTIEQAQAGLGEASATLGYSDITAPFAGRVLERRVEPGTLAAPGTPLLVLADEAGLRVEASVEESRAGDVKLGDDVDVTLGAASKPIRAKVGEIVPDIDVGSRAFLVKVDLPEDAGAIRTGSFARVAFRVGATPRLVVPASAISSLGALDRVYVVEQERARLRMVTRGETFGPFTEILTGLSSGEEVVTAPPPALRDGAKITRASAEPAK